MSPVPQTIHAAPPRERLAGSAVELLTHVSDAVLELGPVGPAGFADVRMLIERVGTAMLERPSLTAMLDLRGTDFVPTMVQAELLLDLLAYRSQVITNRVAIVANPGTQFGMLRLITIKASLRDVPVVAFTREGEARRWLETGIE